MKIVCESCGAKYSIADEKVSGKVFKIRCKRCSEVIVVRGDQQPQPQPAAQAASHAYNYEADAIWHIVVDGEQAGPYAPSQLGEMLTQGMVDWEAYVWTEGFDNWVPMRDVEDLVAAITGQGAQQAEQAAYGAAGAAALDAQPSMGADPFADEPAPSEAGLFGGASEGPDLFGGGGGGAAAGGFGDAGGAVAAHGGGVVASPSPRVSQAQAMTGARNENSVLFSLKNLQALATGTSTPAPPAGGGTNAGFASGEGSGLIDIRALASTTGVSEAPSDGTKDELLSMGTQGGAFGALGSPMLAPAAPEEGDGSKKAILWAVVAAVGLVSVAIVAVAFILKSDGSGSQAVAPVAATAPADPTAAATAIAPPAAKPAEQADTTNDEQEPPSEGELAARQAQQEEDKEDDRTRSTHHRKARHGSSSDDGSSRSARKQDDEPAAAPAERKAPSKPSGPRTLDDLLEGALSSKGGSAPKPAPAPKSDLPEQPTKSQVLSAMNGVRPAVQKCAQGQSGVALVSVTVAGSSGRVTNAQVSGVTGPPGSCIAKAVRGARFPKFQQRVFNIKFPFKL